MTMVQYILGHVLAFLLMFASIKFVYRKYRNSKQTETSEDGTIRYHRNFLRHREDGPAVIYPSGLEEWWKDGKLHRED